MSTSARALSDDDHRLVQAAIAEGRVTLCPPAMPNRQSPPPTPADPARRAGPVGVAGPAPRVLRRMGVRAALEWAFGTEHARLSFGADLSSGLPSFGMEFLLMERGMLGQEVDVSPGRSLPADDAEIIAAAVQAALPDRAALWVEELARAGAMPWKSEPDPRLEPLDWCCGRGGKWRGKTADARTLGAEGWRPLARVNRLGRQVVEPVLYTPCRMTVTAAQIGRLRRAHLEWWSHLLTIRAALKAADLRWIEITDAMPLMTPWTQDA